MIFTKKQSKDFIKQLFEKKQIQTVIEAFHKAMTVQMNIPVSFMNSGSKRVYENLFNSKEFEKNYTVTTSTIQTQIQNIFLDSKQNTAPTKVNMFLTSGNIPYKFTITGSQKVIAIQIGCSLLTANTLDALQHIEYIVDNLSFQKGFNYSANGVQYKATYGLLTSDINGAIDKVFNYSNTENQVRVDFVIEIELNYIAYRSASLIKYIFDRTEDPDDVKPPITETKDPDDETNGGGMEEGDGVIIKEFIGTVATARPISEGSDQYTIDGGTWYHSDGITEDDLIKNVRVTTIDEANKNNKKPINIKSKE